MNRKQLTLILVAFVVLGGLGLWLRNRDVSSYRTTSGAMGQKVLGEFDVNAVARVAVRKGTNSLSLVQKDDRWVVVERGDYPANFADVGDALRKLWDLKTVQVVAGPLGPAAIERLELNPEAPTNAAVVLELQDKDGKALKTLLLGKLHRSRPTSPSPMGGEEGWPDGRYVMLQGQTSGASLVSETFSNLEPKPEAWLNKEFFKADKVLSAAVTYPEATNSWKLDRASETNEWVLADARPEEQLDTTKISSVANALSWPNFEDVVVTPDPVALGLDKPILAELKSADGFHYALKAGKKDGEDKYYLTLSVSADFPKERTAPAEEKPEDKEKLDKEFKEKTDKLTEKLRNEKALEGRVFQVSKWTLDSLFKKRSELLKEAKKEEAPAAATTSPPTLPPSVNPVDATVPPLPPDLPPPDAKDEDE